MVILLMFQNQILIGSVALLKPLLSLGLTDDDFDIEAGQVDGTIAHAIERIISVSAQVVSFSLSSTSSLVNYKEYEFAHFG